MTKLILKCTGCGSASLPLTRYELNRYLKSLRMSDKGINRVLRKLDTIDKEYNKCCDDLLTIEQIAEPKVSLPSESINSDAYKDVKGIDYMNDLHDNYSDHWNNDNSISNYED